MLVFQNNKTAAMFVFQNNKTAAMFVFQTSPVGVDLFSYVKTFFCSHKFANACHLSENAVYTVQCSLFFRKIEHLLLPGVPQIFGSKIQDFFETFLQNDYFFFQNQGCQLGDH